MKTLTVGDVHNVPSEMEDTQNLINFVIQIAEENKVDEVLFMGDLYHFHNVIRAESLYFWRQAFDRLNQFTKVRSLVGNHDLNSESGDPRIHALLAHVGQINIVDKIQVEDGKIYAPYMHDKALFIKTLKPLISKGYILFCHQSFDGAKFDNGFYDPNGIDLEFMPFPTIISGHIHTPQKFGDDRCRVEYIGAPRWRTISDANIDRNIVLYNSEGGIMYADKKYFSTSTICKKIVHFVDTEQEPFDLNLINQKDDFRIDIKGIESYIEKRKKEFLGLPVKIRTIKLNSPKDITIKESEGIKTSFNKYLNSYKPKYGTPLGDLANLSKERLGI